MRRIVPFAGGSSRTGRSALSALPSFRAGAPFVSHRSVSASPGIDVISLTFGAEPVHEEGRLAVGVVAGEHPADSPDHGLLGSRR